MAPRIVNAVVGARMSQKCGCWSQAGPPDARWLDPHPESDLRYSFPTKSTFCSAASSITIIPVQRPPCVGKLTHFKALLLSPTRTASKKVTIAIRGVIILAKLSIASVTISASPAPCPPKERDSTLERLISALVVPASCPQRSSRSSSRWLDSRIAQFLEFSE